MFKFIIALLYRIFIYKPTPIPKPKKFIAISLGWNCDSAVKGVQLGLRKRRVEGYKTCPFDAMISNYNGVVQCILDDFKHFTNPQFLTRVPAPDNPTENYVFNSYYNFYFNHETPGHANLYLEEKWSGGINHFVDNNWKMFIERYQQRITHFKQYLDTPDVTIIFILTGCPGPYTELQQALAIKYPHLDYMILFQPNDKIKEEPYNKYMMAADKSNTTYTSS